LKLKRHISLAKISRPRLPGVLARTRLFRIIDKGRRHPVVWISGPAGSGKTTLVGNYLDVHKLPCLWYQLDEGDADLASFFYYMGLAAKNAAPRHKRPLPLLTPEYGLGIPTFTRRFFENICSRLKPPFVLVFDNYQEVPAESPFHEIIRTGLSALPGNITAVIISRSEPPRAFVGMLAASRLHVIGGKDLALTPEESKGVAKLQDLGTPDGSIFELMHERSQGWVAGLVLLARTVKTRNAGPETLKDIPREKVFDYFASELFDRFDKPMQDFLLKTAFLSKIPVTVAHELTANDAASRILAALNRENYFTEKHDPAGLTYQYHPLFREFLLSRGKTVFSQAEARALQRQAAMLLEAAGQIEDAAEIYLHAQEWQGLTGLILKNAPVLMSDTRAATLGKWLAALPADLVAEDPWLLYWSGASRIFFSHFFSPRESQASLEKAFHLFDERKDPVGTFLSWAGIANCITYAMDDFTQYDTWVPILDRLLKEYGGFPAQEVEGWVASAMIPVISLRQPDNPDFESWKNKALLHKETKINTLFQLAFYYSYRGDSLNASQIRDALYKSAKDPGASALGLIMAKLIDTVSNILLTYDPDQFIRAAHEGLALAEKSGVHILDFMMRGNAVIAALMAGDLPLARSFLEKMAASAEQRSAWERVLYDFVLALDALFNKDLNKALRHAEEALRLVLKVGVRINTVYCYYLNALVRYESGDVESANDLLEKGHRAAEVLGSNQTKQQYHFMRAVFDLSRGLTTRAHADLKSAMAIGREHGGFIMHPPIPPAAMFPACAEALDAQIEVEYVRKLISQYNILPEAATFHLENWPWPLRIYTLGGFRLIVNDKPARFSGKVQKKPLEMLKALIALGGSANEEQVIDALWPDAAGDAGRQSFKTNLHRLRQLIGNENALAYQEGRVSLDPRHCWVDVWVFEKAGQSAGGDRQSEMIRLEKAAEMYKGHFLADDAEKPWTVSMRERLKVKFVKTIRALGEQWEREKEYGKAAALYERALELDDLAEELYQGLMSCHWELGRRADASRVYERCRNNLAAAFGVGPSEETESLFRKIREN
jgi:DNA-binding SARP family transcriptional activator